MNDVHVQLNPSTKPIGSSYLPILNTTDYLPRSNQDQADPPVDIYESVFVGPICRGISFVEREQVKTGNWN
jgi:hypothetical protein